MGHHSALPVSGKIGRTQLLVKWTRTFAIITTDANELVTDIHDRMPVILSRYDYVRWLSEEPDPRDLMRPFPAELIADVANFDPRQ